MKAQKLPQYNCICYPRKIDAKVIFQLLVIISTKKKKKTLFSFWHHTENLPLPGIPNKSLGCFFVLFLFPPI